MKYCENCKRVLKPDASFCTVCGTRAIEVLEEPTGPAKPEKPEKAEKQKREKTKKDKAKKDGGSGSRLTLVLVLLILAAALVLAGLLIFVNRNRISGLFSGSTGEEEDSLLPKVDQNLQALYDSCQIEDLSIEDGEGELLAQCTITVPNYGAYFADCLKDCDTDPEEDEEAFWEEFYGLLLEEGEGEEEEQDYEVDITFWYLEDEDLTEKELTELIRRRVIDDQLELAAYEYRYQEDLTADFLENAEALQEDAAESAAEEKTGAGSAGEAAENAAEAEAGGDSDED